MGGGLEAEHISGIYFSSPICTDPTKDIGPEWRLCFFKNVALLNNFFPNFAADAPYLVPI